MKMWHVLLGMILISVLIIAAVEFTGSRSDRRWEQYSRDHHCKQTANYFDIVHQYTCDGGEKVTR